MNTYMIHHLGLLYDPKHELRVVRIVAHIDEKVRMPSDHLAVTWEGHDGTVVA